MSNQSITLRRKYRDSDRHDHNRDCGARRHRRDARQAQGERVHQIMRADVLALGSLMPGAVVRARITFVDRDDYKVRPAIVVERRGREVLVVPCTTSLRATTHADVQIDELSCAGLGAKTTARVGRAQLIDRLDCIEVLGHLDSEDEARVFALLHASSSVATAA